MLSPLNVYPHLSLRPGRVKYRAMPVSPDFRRSQGRVVPDPHNLLIGRDGEWNPGPVDVIPPKQVIGYDPLLWVKDRDGSGELERFVTLQVQHRCQGPRQHCATIGWREDPGECCGSQWDVCPWAASSRKGKNKTDSG